MYLEVKNKEKENILIKMELIIKDNGLKIQRKVKDLYFTAEIFKEKNMKGFGLKIREAVRENIFIKMVIFMRVNGRVIILILDD